MWVGKSTSPNTVDSAIRINQEVQTTNTPSNEGSPSSLKGARGAMRAMKKLEIEQRNGGWKMAGSGAMLSGWM